MNRLDRLAAEMYHILQGVSPRAMDRDDLMRAMGIVTVSDFHQIKGVLQDLLGATDTINLVADPSNNGLSGWTYSLQGDPTEPAVRAYLVAKTKGILQRQLRQYSIHRSLAAGISGNTVAGRAARRLQRSHYRTIEDTVDVLVELGEPAPSLPPSP